MFHTILVSLYCLRFLHSYILTLLGSQVIMFFDSYIVTFLQSYILRFLHSYILTFLGSQVLRFLGSYILRFLGSQALRFLHILGVSGLGTVVGPWIPRLYRRSVFGGQCVNDRFRHMTTRNSSNQPIQIESNNIRVRT